MIGPSASRFWNDANARQAQLREFVRSLHIPKLGLSRTTLLVPALWRRIETILLQGGSLNLPLSLRRQLSLVVTGTRGRMDALPLKCKPLLRAIRQQHKSIGSPTVILTLLAGGAVGLALIITLLEISVRKELSKEHMRSESDTTAVATPIRDRADFDDVFALSPLASPAAEPPKTAGDTPNPEHGETVGQSRRATARVPLPRPRPKPR